MAVAAVALLLLGLAMAEAQTYTLDLDQPQKVRCVAPQQLKLQLRPYCDILNLETCTTSPGVIKEAWSGSPACHVLADS